MILRNQETGLGLPSAPEFGAEGAWPPFLTDWVPLRWELFEVDPDGDDPGFAVAAYAALWRLSSDRSPARIRPSDPHHPLQMGDGLREDFLLREVQEDQTRSWSAERRVETHALRRLVHLVRWRRKDPVIQLPPGSPYEMTHSITTGLSVEYSQTLAKSLGLSLGSNVSGVQAKLSTELQQQFGLTLEVTAQEQRSTKLTLTNPSADQSRLFALWHVDHRVLVDVLTIEFTSSTSSGQPVWKQRSSVEFATDSDPHITFATVHSA
jgi:hypothetical protein